MRRQLCGVRPDGALAPTRRAPQDGSPTRSNTSAGVPVLDDPAAGLEHDGAGDQVDHLLDAVLDHDRCRARLGEHIGEYRADQGGTRRVEVGGDLVEQQQPGAQREDPGDREALLLAAGERGGRLVAAVGEADG